MFSYQPIRYSELRELSAQLSQDQTALLLKRIYPHYDATSGETAAEIGRYHLLKKWNDEICSETLDSRDVLSQRLGDIGRHDLKEQVEKSKISWSI